MLKMLDLFAGVGVAVAAQAVGGIEEYGVEIMPAAIATRDGLGFNTPYNDVWEIDKAQELGFGPDWAMWASPPARATRSPVAAPDERRSTTCWPRSTTSATRTSTLSRRSVKRSARTATRRHSS